MSKSFKKRLKNAAIGVAASFLLRPEKLGSNQEICKNSIEQDSGVEEDCENFSLLTADDKLISSIDPFSSGTGGFDFDVENQKKKANPAKPRREWRPDWNEQL